MGSLLATVAYTWSHARDNSNGAFSTGTSGAGTRMFVLPGGVPDLKDNYGNSDSDQRNVFVASAVYSLPFGRGKIFGARMNRGLDAVVGGWQVNTIVTLSSGTPIDFSTSGNNIGGNFDNRPDFISFHKVASTLVGGTSNANNRTFFQGTFALPPVNANGQFVRAGNLRRNAFSGPGFKTADVGLFKGFHVTERVNTEFRAQAYNLFNTPQFSNPDTSIKDGYNATGTTTFVTGANPAGQNNGFGSISGTRNGTERQLELAIHVNF